MMKHEFTFALRFSAFAVIAFALANVAVAESYTAIIAQQIALVTIEPAPAPPPTPSPAPGVCANCKGTGRLGDGTISVPCPVCGGDGKIEAALAKHNCRCEANGGVCECAPCTCNDPRKVPATSDIQDINRRLDNLLLSEGIEMTREEPPARRDSVAPAVLQRPAAPLRRGLFRRRGGG